MNPNKDFPKRKWIVAVRPLVNIVLSLLLVASSFAGMHVAKAQAVQATALPPLNVIAAAAPPPASQVNLIGQLGGILKGAAIAGNYAFLAEGARLTILDISNPAVPVVVGKTAPFAELIQGIGVATDGNHVYLAMGNLGLRVVDTVTKTSPVEVGYYTWGASANGVSVVSGDYVIVTDASNAKFWVISVHTPASPFLAGSTASMTGLPKKVVVNGDVAYVVTAGNLLLQYNIGGGNITSPLLSGTVNLATLTNPLTSPVDVAVDASGSPAFAYVVGTEGLRRINLSSGAQVSTYAPVGLAIAGVRVDQPGDSVFVAASNYGMQVLNLTLSTLKGTFTLSPVFSLTDVIKSGIYAYGVDPAIGLRVVSIPLTWSNPPLTLSQVALYRAVSVHDVVVSGNNAFLATNKSGLDIVSVTAPTTPFYVGSYAMSGQARGVDVANYRAYMAEFNQVNNGGLQILDVSSPAFPTPLGAPVTVSGNAASNVDVDGDYAYMAASTSGLQVIRLTGTPMTVASFVLAGSPTPWAYDVFKSGSYAYIAYGSDGLRIVNVPASPSGSLTEAGFYATLGDARGVDLNGEYAYVAAGNNGLQVINVANKTSPSRAGSLALTSGEAQDVVVSGTTAYLAAGTSGLRLINVSDPANPVEFGYYDTPGFATRVFVDANYVYVADDGGGLFILQVSSIVTPTPTFTPTLTPSATTTYIPGPYTVSGRASLANGSALQGVTIFSSAGTSAATDSNGNYIVSGIVPGAYSLVAVLSGYACSPAILTGTAPGDISNKNFLCSPLPLGPYSISGRITNSANGSPLPAVFVSDGVRMTMTDGSGNYVLSGLTSGNYTLTAALSGYTFTSAFINPVTITNANVTGKDFLGTSGSSGPYSITGRITDSDYNPIPGVTVSDGTRSAVTNSNGIYTINNVPYGSYMIIPLKEGNSFSPASMNIAVPPNASGVDFRAAVNPPYSVSGRITDPSGMPVPNVTITDGSGRTTATDSNGHYALTGLPGGAYTITPAKLGFTFSPSTIVGTVPPNAINRDFTALPSATYSVSGRVADSSGTPIAGATVMDVSGRTTTTDSNGNYVLMGVPKGNYTITATKGGYIFSPQELKGSVPPNATGQNFTGTMVATATFTPTSAPTTVTPTFTPSGPTPTPTATFTPTPALGNSVSGTVRDATGNPLPGVNVSDGKGHGMLTDSAGKYMLSGLDAGTYTITPLLLGYICNPPYRQVTLPPNAIVDFTCTPQTYNISGMVMDAHGSPIDGVTIVDNAGHTAVSAANGTYTLQNLLPATYVLVPSKPEFIFWPASRSVTLPPDAITQNFFGSSGVIEVIVNGDMEKNEAWVMPYDRAGYSWDTGVMVKLDEMMPQLSVPQESLQKEAAAAYDSQEHHGGNRSIRVGILDPAKNVLSYSTLRQRVFIPQAAQCAQLRFWLKPLSEKGIDGMDFQMVSVLDDNLNQIDRVVTLRSDKRAWDFYSADLNVNKLKGQYIWVYFGVFNDGKNSVMATYVDDVSLLTCSKNIPPLPPTYTPTPFPVTLMPTVVPPTATVLPAH